jgi:hypothetical protein
MDAKRAQTLAIFTAVYVVIKIMKFGYRRSTRPAFVDSTAATFDAHPKKFAAAGALLILVFIVLMVRHRNNNKAHGIAGRAAHTTP